MSQSQDEFIYHAPEKIETIKYKKNPVSVMDEDDEIDLVSEPLAMNRQMREMMSTPFDTQKFRTQRLMMLGAYLATIVSLFSVIVFQIVIFEESVSKREVWLAPFFPLSGFRKKDDQLMIKLCFKSLIPVYTGVIFKNYTLPNIETICDKKIKSLTDDLRSRKVKSFILLEDKDLENFYLKRASDQFEYLLILDTPTEPHHESNTSRSYGTESKSLWIKAIRDQNSSSSSSAVPQSNESMKKLITLDINPQVEIGTAVTKFLMEHQSMAHMNTFWLIKTSAMDKWNSSDITFLLYRIVCFLPGSFIIEEMWDDLKILSENNQDDSYSNMEKALQSMTSLLSESAEALMQDQYRMIKNVSEIVIIFRESTEVLQIGRLMVVCFQEVDRMDMKELLIANRVYFNDVKVFLGNMSIVTEFNNFSCQQNDYTIYALF